MQRSTATVDPDIAVLQIRDGPSADDAESIDPTDRRTDMRIPLTLLILVAGLMTIGSAAAEDTAPPVLRGKIYAFHTKYKGGTSGLSWSITVLDKRYGGVGVASTSIEIMGEQASYTVRPYGEDIKLKGYHILPKNAPLDVPITITAVDANGNVTCAHLVMQRRDPRAGRDVYYGKLRLRNISGCDDG